MATLPDAFIEEILLRVAPDDPASLVRAALACRRWCGLVADPSFRRRRLALHGAKLPVLGFLCDGVSPDGGQPFARFVPTSSCRPPRAGDHDRRGLWSYDARHGRVLLHRRDYRDFVVWDPITDQRVVLPSLPWFLSARSMKATVLCAATGTCDHLNCHRGPFIVVLVGINGRPVSLDVLPRRWVPTNMFSCIYSSESSSWSEPTYADHPGDNVNVSWARSALVGNALFFALTRYDRILKYDLGTQEMSVIELPYVRTSMVFTEFVPIELTTLEDGRLGFARVEESNQLCLWSRDESDEVQGWTLCKVIDLNSLFPHADSHSLKWCLVCFVGSVLCRFSGGATWALYH